MPHAQRTFHEDGRRRPYESAHKPGPAIPERDLTKLSCTPSKSLQQLDLTLGRVRHDRLPLGERQASGFAMKAHLITQEGMEAQDTHLLRLERSAAARTDGGGGETGLSAAPALERIGQ